MTDETAEQIKQEKLEALKRRAAGGPDTPIDIESRSHLEDVLDSNTVVLVDCHADWCGPCQQLKPIVKQVASETNAAVAVVDIDRHPDLAQNWSVRSVPTLLLFVDGEMEERVMGVQPFDRLSALIGQHTD